MGWKSQKIRGEMARRALPLQSHEFITNRICSLVSGRLSHASDGGEWKCSVVQNLGTGTLTLRYDLGPSLVIYGKLYSDEAGSWSYEVQRTLWSNGFGNGSRHQVPETLALFPDHNMLVMRGLPGKSIEAAIAGDGNGTNLDEACRKTADWLAALHRCDVRLGKPESRADALKTDLITSRLNTTVAEQPQYRDLLRELEESLRRQIRNLPPCMRVVQTNGHLIQAHVFVSPDATSVIDWDMSRPSYPAKDVALFIRSLHWAAFRMGSDRTRIDSATTAFLRQYLSQVPEVEAELGCYCACFSFMKLVRSVKRLHKKGPVMREEVDFCLQETQRAMEMKL